MNKSLSEIKNFISKKHYDKALIICNELIENAENKIEYLRLRASIFAFQGHYPEAIVDRKKILEGNSPLITDFFLGAFNAISCDEYGLAIKWLNEMIDLAPTQADDDFDVVGYFLRAYCEMQLRNFDVALQSVNHAQRLNPNFKLPIPGEIGVASVDHLKEEIIRRKNA